MRARINRATTLYSVDPRTRTMMQPCASAAKLRGGGPILCYGVISHGVHRVTATSNRHRRSITGPTGPKLSGAFSNLRSLRRAQNDSVRHYSLSHEPPQGDQKLARQGHDHGLARAARVLGACTKPLRQGAVLLDMRNRHANWIMPRRTRALPERANPFSWRFFPLSSGEPVRPA